MKKQWMQAGLCLALCTGMVTPSTLCVLAEETETATETKSRADAPTEVKTLAGKLINYYANGYYADFRHGLKEMVALDETWGPMWKDILSGWDWFETGMQENIGVAPDGLENPAKHCFIVLGYALNSDGTMADELVGRLEVALASWKKYPESYVLVTGGVEKNGWTEGQCMHDWLIEQGVPEEQIIVEKEAANTVGNAANSFKMLYLDYDVDTVSLISSQYHLKRGSLLYYAESILKAWELSEQPVQFLSEMNAGWLKAGTTSESMSLKASGLRSITQASNTSITGTTTEITGLSVSGQSQYALGEPINIQATTIDSLNYSEDVTDLCTVQNYNALAPGTQTITVVYTQNGVSYTGEMEVEVLPLEEDAIDRQALQDYIELCDEIDISTATKASGSAFAAALDEAKRVADDENASEQEITDAYHALQSAADGLKELVNLALSKPVSANYDGQSNAYKVTDGVISTSNYWASMITSSQNAPAANSYFVIDLEQECSLESIVVYPYWGGISRYYLYDLYISMDGQTWTQIEEWRNTAYCPSSGNTTELETPMLARYIKLQGVLTYVYNRSDINNIHIIELTAWGNVISDDEAGARQLLNAYLDGLDFDQSQYTVSSWAAFEAVKEQAIETSQNPNATLEQLQDAKTSVEAAAAALEIRAAQEDLAALAAKANQARDLKDSLDAESFAALEPLIAQADTLTGTPEDASAAQTADVYARLSALVYVLSGEQEKDEKKDQLQQLVTSIETDILPETEKVQPARVQALESALEDARDLLESENASAQDYQDAMDALHECLGKMYLIVDKEELLYLLELTGELKQPLYTEESWAVLSAAMKAGTLVSVNDDASQEEVTAAMQGISRAIAALKKAPVTDTRALIYEIQSAKAILENDSIYVSETLTDLRKALEEGQAVLAGNSSQEEIAAAVAALADARLAVRTLADKSELEQAIAQAMTLQTAALEDEQAALFEQALTVATAALKATAISQEDVDAACAQLAEAVSHVEALTQNTLQQEMNPADTASKLEETLLPEDIQADISTAADSLQSTGSNLSQTRIETQQTAESVQPVSAQSVQESLNPAQSLESTKKSATSSSVKTSVFAAPYVLMDAAAAGALAWLFKKKRQDGKERR